MIKLCDKNYEIFLGEWKKINVVPVSKKEDHHYVKNGKLVSPLRVLNNMSERIIYNDIFKYFPDNHLISSNQFGLKPGESI